MPSKRKEPVITVEATDEGRAVLQEIPLSQIIPKKLYEAQQSEWALKSDDQLMKECTPDSIDWRLRIRYNSLVQQVLDPMCPLERKVIRVEDIYSDICSYEVYRRRVDLTPKAVFITRKIGNYLEEQDSMLTAFSARLWEIASMPITNAAGGVDHEAVKLIHRTINLLLDRKFGQAVQRHVNAQLPTPENMDPLAVQKQVAFLESLDVKGK